MALTRARLLKHGFRVHGNRSYRSDSGTFILGLLDIYGLTSSDSSTRLQSLFLASYRSLLNGSCSLSRESGPLTTFLKKTPVTPRPVFTPMCVCVYPDVCLGIAHVSGKVPLSGQGVW